jgi:hypothetical protein
MLSFCLPISLAPHPSAEVELREYISVHAYKKHKTETFSKPVRDFCCFLKI